MDYRKAISETFGGKAFEQPLFYRHDAGLRFELSERGDWLNQFMTAHRKGLEICGDVFDGDDLLVVCLKFHGNASLLSSLPVFRSLKQLGISPRGDAEHWSEPSGDEPPDDGGFERVHYVSYALSAEFLPNLLWCAFSRDFPVIAPRPAADVYLFNFRRGIMVFPYDDRGMDVVGPNHAALKTLYAKFGRYLLEFDRSRMDSVFSDD